MRLFSSLLLLWLTGACSSTAGGQTGEEQRRGDAGNEASTGGAAGNDAMPEASPAEDPCLKGFVRDAPGETRACILTHAGRCFGNVEDACACLGCPRALCNILASNPGQVSCDSVDLPGCENGVAPIVLGDGPCEVMSMGLCFEDAADACVCGGCEPGCGITRSDPGQVILCNP